MPVFESDYLHRFYDSGQVFAADRDIDVFRQAPGVSLGLLHIQVCRQPAHDPILDTGRTEGPFHAGRETKKILQPFLEKRVDEE
jgi:hypothetical protein